jgi:hypothetical protein
VRYGPTKHKVQNSGSEGKKNFEAEGVLHSVNVAASPELGNVYAPGLANGIDDNYVNKIYLIGYVNRRHCDVSQAGNHKVVNQGDHAHDELLKHDRQGDCQSLPVKRQGAEMG